MWVLKISEKRTFYFCKIYKSFNENSFELNYRYDYMHIGIKKNMFIKFYFSNQGPEKTVTIETVCNRKQNYFNIIRFGYFLITLSSLD